MTLVTTKCDYNVNVMTCQQLSEAQLLPSGSVSFSPTAASGNFTAPLGCGYSPVLLGYDGSHFYFSAQRTPVLAVIARDAGSKAFFFGTGAMQGKVATGRLSAVELCFGPGSGPPLVVTQTASYSPGMTPGTVNWSFKKSVQLPAVYDKGVVNMFTGDSADAAWTLAVTKSGTDTTFQGFVTGQITLSNNQQVPIAIYGITNSITNGPTATVTCGAALPFRMPACASTVCKYVVQYPETPSPGTYTLSATVNFQSEGAAALAATSSSAAVQVGARPDDGSLSSSMGNIPAGQAVVTDTSLPGQSFKYQGTGHQSYVTTLKCPATGSVTNTATLHASTGQRLTSTASVVKNCFDLTVRLGNISPPTIAKWAWKVQKSASVSSISLLAASNSSDSRQADPTASGSTVMDVIYTVQYTRSPPAVTANGGSPFSVTGTVTIHNPAPINAKLAGVAISIQDPAGAAMPYVVAAVCPILTVASGQPLSCSWLGKPMFNPSGAQVIATARYINTNNGASPSGTTKDYVSAPVLIGTTGGGGAGSAADSAAGGTFGRRLLQWGTGTFDSSSIISQFFGANAGTIVSSGSSGVLPFQQVSETPPGLVAIPPSLTATAPSMPAITWGAALAGNWATPSNWPTADANLKAAPPPAVAPSAAPPPGGSTSPAATSWNVRPAALPPAWMASPSSTWAGGAPATASKSGYRSAAPFNTLDTSSYFSLVTTDISTLPVAPLVSDSNPVAGSTAGAAKAGVLFKGMLDECAQVGDSLAVGTTFLTGDLVSGEKPKGRICDSTTFVYTIRYGPYTTCGSQSRTLGTAVLTADDTNTFSSAKTDIPVTVSHCGPDLVAKVTAASGVQDIKYNWTLSYKQQQPGLLNLSWNKAGNYSFSVAYAKGIALGDVRLNVTVNLQNSGPATLSITEAQYVVHGTCDHQNVTKGGSFSCGDSSLTAYDNRRCSFLVHLDCASAGKVELRLKTLNSGMPVTAMSSFEEPAINLPAQASVLECVSAFHYFNKSSAQTVGGILASGQPPSGKVCANKIFNFTSKLGPFTKCGTHQVRVQMERSSVPHPQP
eukprot:gene8484-8666_t